MVTQLHPPYGHQLSDAELRRIAEHIRRLERPRVALVVVASGLILAALLAWMAVICGGLRILEALL